MVGHLAEEGLTLKEGASLMRVSAGTLRGWKRRWAKGTLGPNLLGRPGLSCPAQLAREIRGLADAVGVEVSVRYVRERMDWVPRAILEREVRAFKQERRREERTGLDKLDWAGAGRAWVCDWTEPEEPIDGVFPEVLVVRDLGSHRNIQSLPVRAQSGVLAAQVLESLFLAHGAPLVLKTDGGGEFGVGEMKAVLTRFGVSHLVSPPYYPPYNGAIEAGIGSLKTHAWHQAAREGRLGCWTCDDIEAGRLKANETSRPWGVHGPSPDQVWSARTAIGDEERRAFLELVGTNRTPHDKLTDRTKGELKTDERHAIEKTLEDGGYLVIARRENPLGVFGEKGVNF